jgi:hypothetical protein
MNVIRASLLLFAAIAAAYVLAYTQAESATTGGFIVLVVGSNDEPVPNATVTITSPNLSRSLVTGSNGIAVVSSVPPDTYSVIVTVPGFDSQSVNGIVVLADQAMTVRVKLAQAPLPTPAPRASPTPVPPPPPTPTPAPLAWPPISASLLTAYNNTYPEHSSGDPYFGRYTYVILSHGDARSLAFIEALLGRSISSTGSIVGAPAKITNTLGYNLFLIAIGKNPGTSVAPSVAQGLLKAFDFGAALNVRSRYCVVPAHRLNHLCKAPYDYGPITLTFLQPLNELKANDPLPPAVALDMSGIPENQFDAAIGELQVSMSIPMSVSEDQSLSPSLVSRYLAPWLDNLNAALVAVAPKISVIMDLFKPPGSGGH